ncbi:hypothetical protein [Streptomyces sp. NPDC050804]|uniref:hypothetical protein n=1 Tax=Streptomyces sp. NPDC050804 TaxID=3154745 RepID=UPI00343BF40F
MPTTASASASFSLGTTFPIAAHASTTDTSLPVSVAGAVSSSTPTALAEGASPAVPHRTH